MSSSPNHLSILSRNVALSGKLNKGNHNSCQGNEDISYAVLRAVITMYDILIEFHTARLTWQLFKYVYDFSQLITSKRYHENNNNNFFLKCYSNVRENCLGTAWINQWRRLLKNQDFGLKEGNVKILATLILCYFVIQWTCGHLVN